MEVTGLRSTRNVELGIVRLVSVVGTCGLLEHVVIFLMIFMSLLDCCSLRPHSGEFGSSLVQHLGT